MQALFPNDSGPAVQFVQERLALLGYGGLEPTGTLDASTLAALDQLQQDRQVPERGHVGDATWLILLDVAPSVGGPLSFGDTGEPVPDDLDFASIPADGAGWLLGEVQLRLRALGYPCGDERTNGPATQNGLRAFQASQYLEATGALDSETLLALRVATREAGPIFLFADEADLRGSKGPLSFAGEHRDVDGDGGYRYRQYEDGSITLVASPKGPSAGVTLRSGAAWAAITAEIGPYPTTSPSKVEGPVGPALPDPMLQAERDRLSALAEPGISALPPEAAPQVRAVLSEAISWVGKREIPKGSNGGPEIDVITAGVVPASSPRPPWCALAVSHWLKEGLHAARWKDTPMGIRNASALAFGRWGEAQGRLSPTSGPAAAGSIFVMRRAGSGSDASKQTTTASGWSGLGHTGLVVADLGDQVVTIEGNMGDRCWSSTRSKADLLGFVRWW